MAEPSRDPNAPQNPPRSVLSKDVRRSALWTYLAPLVLFFAGVAVVLVYWGNSPPAPARVEQPRATGTTGTERDGSRERTPGGHEPQPDMAKPEGEVEHRAGRTIATLRDVFDDNSRGAIGRRVEFRKVEVERVESPVLFWIRDGDARIAVTIETGAKVRAGQSVNVIGAVERSGDSVRIQASRVEPAQ